MQATPGVERIPILGNHEIQGLRSFRIIGSKNHNSDHLGKNIRHVSIVATSAPSFSQYWSNFEFQKEKHQNRDIRDIKGANLSKDLQGKILKI